MLPCSAERVQSENKKNLHFSKTPMSKPAPKIPKGKWDKIRLEKWSKICHPDYLHLLKPLEKAQRSKLQKLLDPYLAPQKSHFYGPKVKRRCNENRCRRSKDPPRFTNDITEFPKGVKAMKLCHITFMLENNVQLPDPDILELCHRGADPNLQNKSRHYTGALCFEGTHMVLMPKYINLQMKSCHKIIKDFVRLNRHKSSVRTTGTLYVSDVVEQTDDDNLKSVECVHKPHCFGNFGD